jgi:hypothetical protein
MRQRILNAAIFLTLTPDCPVILDRRATRDVSNADEEEDGKSVRHIVQKIEERSDLLRCVRKLLKRISL